MKKPWWLVARLCAAVVFMSAGCETVSVVRGEDTAEGVNSSDAAVQWEQIATGLGKSQVMNVLGVPSEIEYGEFVEWWRYQYADGRTGTIKFTKPGLDLFYTVGEFTAP